MLGGVELFIFDYYYMIMCDVFVGVMCVIGLFLICYIGYEKVFEEWLLDDIIIMIFGVVVFGVVMFLNEGFDLGFVKIII